MAKPAGPACNLRCRYCFYLEKRALWAEGSDPVMAPEVLEAYVVQCVRANRGLPGGVPFTWQGGEPTLAGLGFFRAALELERRHCRDIPFANALQTNGLLLDDRWCEFLAANRFLVGLSLDGPAAIHDAHRRGASGEPSHERVLETLRRLKQHGVEFNVLAAVTAEAAGRPLEIYDFLRGQGVDYIQFLPVVERVPDARSRQLGLELGMPGPAGESEPARVTPWSVGPEAWGDFLAAVFARWIGRDVGRAFVMNFEWALGARLGEPGLVCYLNRTCGRACVVERNGDVYACDHWVYPAYRLGNLLENDLRALVDSPRQREWGAAKSDRLAPECLACDLLPRCRGGCPKHRFVTTSSGSDRGNYLCPGFRRFHRQADPYLAGLQLLLENGLSGDRIMEALGRPLQLISPRNRRPLSLELPRPGS